MKILELIFTVLLSCIFIVVFNYFCNDYGMHIGFNIYNVLFISLIGSAGLVGVVFLSYIFSL